MHFSFLLKLAISRVLSSGASIPSDLHRRQGVGPGGVISCAENVKLANRFLIEQCAIDLSTVPGQSVLFAPLPVQNQEFQCDDAVRRLNEVAAENGLSASGPFPLSVLPCSGDTNLGGHALLTTQPPPEIVTLIENGLRNAASGDRRGAGSVAGQPNDALFLPFRCF